MVTTGQLAGITKQYGAIVERVANGSFDPVFVKEALQDIIERRASQLKTATPPTKPLWYVAPDYQMERLLKCNTDCDWGFTDSDFPSLLESFTPRTASQVPLLVAYFPSLGKISGLQRTFDESWNVIKPPTDCSKWRWDKLRSDPKHLRQVPDQIWRPGIRWVGFDPCAYQGLSPALAQSRAKADGQTSAGVEVLQAANLLSGWMESWDGETSLFPNMSGLQCYFDGAWTDVPYLGLWDGRVRLSALRAGHAHPGWASPTAEDLLAA